jgi:predicted phage terminase large subunit-like protein
MQTQLTQQLIDDAWRFNLWTYAERASGGRWIAYLWLRYLARKLQDAILAGGARIVVTAPPRHGKSSLLSYWLPVWFLDLFPRKRVILTSYTAPLAVSWGRRARDEFDGHNPNTWSRLNPAHSSAADWETTEGGGMRCAGVGGGITGHGADLGLVDDPHKDWASVQSPTQRKMVHEWFDSTFMTRLEPGASVIVLQTRWNEDDQAGHLIEKGWTEIRLPALAEEGDPLGREEGEALCPERYDEAALARIKNSRDGIGSMMFAGLYQQRPGPAEGNVIKREWFRYYGGPTKIELPEVGKIRQSWDLNLGKMPKDVKKASRVVGQCWGENKANVYLLAQERDVWPYPVAKKKVKAFAEAWPAYHEILVEDAAAGAPLVAELKGEIRKLIAVTPTGSKQARLEFVASMFEAGNIWLPHPTSAPWVSELVEEVVTFPNAEHDDQVDTLSQALARYKSRSKARGSMKLNSEVGAQQNPWSY